MRKKNSGSSLELLLDTICNTFGGILFIAMLVVILLNMSSRQIRSEPPSKLAQAELAQRSAELRSELERLRMVVAEQKKTEKSIGWTPDLADAVKEFKSAQKNRADLTRQKAEVLGQVSQSQQEVNRIAENLKELDQNLAAKRQELRRIEQELQKEVAVRSRSSELPRQHATTKIGVPVFMQGGRLSVCGKCTPDGRLIPNPAEYVETTDAQGTSIKPKPGAGTPVDPRGDASGAVAARIAEFDKNQHYLQVFVWPDSFQYFAVLKSLMVRNGFEYHLVPVPNDARISFSNAKRGPVQVQ